MIEVYHAAPGRSVRVLWLLEELGLEYRVHRLQPPIREKRPDYLELSPAGTFPTVIDDGLVLRESLSICDHLARHHGGEQLVRDPGDKDYREYSEWLLFGEATLGVPLVNIMRYGPHQSEDRQIPQAVTDSRIAFGHRLAALELRLKEMAHPGGPEFTLADFSVGYVLWLSKSFFGLGGAFGGHTKAYLARLLEREPLQRAIAAG